METLVGLGTIDARDRSIDLVGIVAAVARLGLARFLLPKDESRAHGSRSSTSRSLEACGRRR